MRNPLLLSCFILFLAACRNDAAVGTDVAIDETSVVAVPESPEAITYSVWNTAPNPESVSINGGRVFVTHFGPKLEPSTKDGDGYIAEYDANGTLADTLITGLHAPKGTVVRGRSLYVADVDRLIGVNTTTGEKIVEISFAGKSQFLNGLAAGASDLLYVSGTDAGKVWSVVPRTNEIKVVADIPGANGVAYDPAQKCLYVVQYLQDDASNGQVFRVDISSGMATVQGTYKGLLDGALVRGGTLYFTDWNGEAGGKLLAMNLQTQEVTTVAQDNLLSGPANFDMLPDGLALIPMLTGSRVVAVPTQLD